MLSQVDYGLARRARLAEVRSGRVPTSEVCDPHPYLLRAARFHGEATERTCPLCRRNPLTHVTYTYGDAFRAETDGRVRATRELVPLAEEVGEFTAYVVEVCQTCGWNHLVTSFVLAADRPPARRPAQGRRRTSGAAPAGARAGARPAAAQE